MTFFSTTQRTVVLATTAIFLAGCAAPPNGGGSTFGGSDENPCSVGAGAVLGGALGAVLGGATGGKKGAITGAVLGGALGAAVCVAVNVQSRQTKTAMQVDQEYRKRQGALPREPMVVSYTSQVNSPSIRKGQPIKVNSVVELTSGTVQPVQSVKEELVVFNPDGTQINPDPKSKNFTASSGGRFENSFELNLPPNLSQGSYAMKTRLYVNDKLVGTRDLRTQLVWNGNSGVVVAMN